MIIERALHLYFSAAELMKDCQKSGEGKKKCKYCRRIDTAIHEIEPIEEEFLKYFGLFAADVEMRLKNLDDKTFNKYYKRRTEIKKRLLFLKGNKGAEEVPAEFLSLFEKLDSAIKNHPDLD